MSCSAIAALVMATAQLAAAAAAHAHDAESHARPGSQDPVLAPGYGELGFEPPKPGTYALPPLFDAADGQVLDSDGKPASLHAVFGGKVVLLSFIYASCPDVNGCPLATSVLHRLKSRLREEPGLSDALRLVSLSFDPARDTPDAMRRYGEAFQGAGVDWQFLTTASHAELQPILSGYGQSVRQQVDASGKPLGPLAHILRVLLIDAAARVRNIYTVSFLHPDTLVSDVKTLLLEAHRPNVAAPEPDAARGTRSLVPVTRRPGDDRTGYASTDYRTRSVDLGSRRGQSADLFARAGQPALGLPALPVPTDNPLTQKKIELGRKLFFDRRLSSNNTLSCGMCHIPEQGFSNNELATAVGIEGRTVRRNAPTVLDSAYQPLLFHDGRENRLEHQVWGPLLAPNEMGNPSIGAVLDTVRRAADYAGLFEAAFPGRGLAVETLGMAIASYERALFTGTSAFDRWYYGKDPAALSGRAQRGFRLFIGKAACATCHRVGPDAALFSDGGLHNTGVGYAAAMGRTAQTDGRTQRIQVAPGDYIDVDKSIVAQVSEPKPSDLGRYEITLDPADRWKYRTPTLRNVALTAPYMHDGSLANLHDVVAFYDRGGIPNPLLDPRIRPLGLQPDERRDLVAFLATLTGGDVDTLISDAFAAPIGNPPTDD